MDDMAIQTRKRKASTPEAPIPELSDEIVVGCVQFLKKKALCKQKIPRHIKLAIHAWSTKCR
jgi:hypothetical protein